jgi:hypothetical protein
MPEEPKIEKAHCNKCLRWTNHVVVHSLQTTWEDVIDEDEGYSIDGGDIWDLLQCRGCDSVRMKHRHWFSEDYDDRGRPTVHTEFFPPTSTRQKPIWRRNLLPLVWGLERFNGLMDEIYNALAQGSFRLAAMGIRALVERLMIDQVEDKGTFEQNMAAFFKAGYVAQVQQGLFKDTLIEAGHAAMHRDFEPTADTINTLLDIVEGIMHTVYYAPVAAEQAKKTIPPRK